MARRNPRRSASQQVAALASGAGGMQIASGTCSGCITGLPEMGRSSPHQPAPVAGADKHRRRRSSSSSDLRPRVCRALFTICISCDRGQRYCSPECRSEVRRRQRHDANCRYQQSDLGRDSKSALSAALSRAGVATSRDRSRYRADHFAGASSEDDRLPVRDLRSPQSLD
jgi:hypothetical protein